MKELAVFYSDIRQILQNARSRAYSEINRAMVEAYWLIGKRIVEEEQEGKARAEYGKKLLENLSKNLTREFGKGFSYANLRNFRQFYLIYPDEEIRYTLCSKLSWSHNRLIMRLENAKARNYYLSEAARQGWSVRQLQRNINTLYYERLLSSQQSRTDIAIDFPTIPYDQQIKTIERKQDFNQQHSRLLSKIIRQEPLFGKLKVSSSPITTRAIRGLVSATAISGFKNYPVPSGYHHYRNRV